MISIKNATKVWLGGIVCILVIVGVYGTKYVLPTTDEGYDGQEQVAEIREDGVKPEMRSQEVGVENGVSSTTNNLIPAGLSTTPLSKVPVTNTAIGTTPPMYPWKRATATVFWVGEGESTDNGFIHNRASAWDETWDTSFGGDDDPEDRCGYRPCTFVPKQNPFYVALPYIERNEDETIKESAKAIPWYVETLFEHGVLLKNRWVEIRTISASCYAQWEDVGPFETDDFAYVFGTSSAPKNSVDMRAGIDLSPAVRDCLGVEDVSLVWWRFVDSSQVPHGPWVYKQL